MKLYVIKDVVAGRMAVDAPVLTLMNNDQEALRALKAVGSGKNIYTEKAEDIQLWCVGDFDNETGYITNNKPYLIGNLIDFVKFDKNIRSNGENINSDKKGDLEIES